MWNSKHIITTLQRWTTSHISWDESGTFLSFLILRQSFSGLRYQRQTEYVNVMTEQMQGVRLIPESIHKIRPISGFTQIKNASARTGQGYLSSMPQGLFQGIDQFCPIMTGCIFLIIYAKKNKYPM